MTTLARISRRSLLLTLTGVLLMFYYIPSTEKAWQTMQDIRSLQPFGYLLRNLHRWAAHAMRFSRRLAELLTTHTGRRPRCGRLVGSTSGGTVPQPVGR